MNRQLQILEILHSLSLAYPYAKVGEAHLSVYAKALGGIDPQVLEVACQQASIQCEFFPTLHQLRNIITDMSYGKVPVAEEAWEQVTAWLAGKTPQPAEPLIRRVVDAIGEFQLRRSENLMADRAHFLKMYASLRERERQELMAIPAFAQVQQHKLNERYGENQQRLQGEVLDAPTEAGESEKYVPMPEEVAEKLKKFSLLKLVVPEG